MTILTITTLADLDKAARAFYHLMGTHRVFAFYGPMGIGKTTFIKALCKIFSVKDAISSPTFSIVNEYFSGQQEQLFHFDFYRINSQEEAFDFGYEDYFYSGAYCFIEWPEKIENLLPPDCVRVEIIETAEKRELRVSL